MKWNKFDLKRSRGGISLSANWSPLDSYLLPGTIFIIGRVGYHTQPDVHSYHPLLLYLTLLGYVRLGKVEGMVEWCQEKIVSIGKGKIG